MYKLSCMSLNGRKLLSPFIFPSGCWGYGYNSIVLAANYVHEVTLGYNKIERMWVPYTVEGHSSPHQPANVLNVKNKLIPC